MIDPNVIRNQIQTVIENLKHRGTEIDIEHIQDLEQQRKQLQVSTQALQSQRNTLSKSIGQAKAKKEDASALMHEVESVNQQLAQVEADLNHVLEQQKLSWSYLPNIIHDSVPIGQSEADNVEIRRWGTPTEFDFEVQDHVSLTAQNASIDFEQSAKMSGARFAILKGALAKLHRALAQFMLETHTTEHGYQEMYVPYLVESHALFGVGQLPKFSQEMFKTDSERDLFLISTAEVPLANMVRESILDALELPLKMVSHTPCFRSEAGSYGKDTKGMIRQHQFDKVELVQVVKPEDSYATLEQLTQHAETILQRLNLPYRVMALCSGDIGFQAAKTYDLEVWLPSQNRYREISSCSNTESFQSRRMQARYRAAPGAKPEYLHILNGSGLAVGRTLIAVLENYQDSNGHIHIPEVLYPYMGDIRVIKP